MALLRRDKHAAEQVKRDTALVNRLPAATPPFHSACCLTLYDMKISALTIRLDPDLEEQLDRLARESGKSRSELARDALRRQLAVLQFEQARRQIMPFAEARGYLTDEDIFDAES